MAAAGGRGVRPAALAGPEAGRFRLDGRPVEADVLAPRLARGTGRPAVDAGAGHRGDEAAVGCRVASDEGFPARVRRSEGGRGLGHGLKHRSEEHTSELQSLMRNSYAD